jgi:hypothetical protein
MGVYDEVKMTVPMVVRCKHSLLRFSLTTVPLTDYHWDRHLYFVIYSHHAQTMTHTPPSADSRTTTHTPPSDDSLLVHLLVVPAACDSD